MAVADLNRNAGNVKQKASAMAVAQVSTSAGVPSGTNFIIPLSSTWNFEKTVNTTDIADAGGTNYTVVDNIVGSWSAELIQQDYATMETFMEDLEDAYIMMVQEVSNVPEADGSVTYILANVKIFGNMAVAGPGGTIPITGTPEAPSADLNILLTSFADPVFQKSLTLVTGTIKAGQPFGFVNIA